MDDQSVEIIHLDKESEIKMPWPLLIVVCFMLLSGVMIFFHGLSRITHYGLGLIPVIIGVAMLWFAVAVHRLQKKGYIGGLVLTGFGAASNLYQLLMPGGKIVPECITLGLSLIPVIILFLYRGRFINK